MKEHREIRIDECDGGYIVRFDWDYNESREKDAAVPQDRRHVFTDLDSAIASADLFLRIPLEDAITASRR